MSLRLHTAAFVLLTSCLALSCKPSNDHHSLHDDQESNASASISEQDGVLRLVFGSSAYKIKDLKDLATTTTVKDNIVATVQARKFMPLGGKDKSPSFSFKLYLDDGRICTTTNKAQKLKGPVPFSCKEAGTGDVPNATSDDNKPGTATGSQPSATTPNTGDKTAKDEPVKPRFTESAPHSISSGKPPHVILRYIIEKATKPKEGETEAQDELKILAALSYTEGVTAFTYTIQDGQLSTKNTLNSATSSVELNDFAVLVDLSLTLKDGQTYKLDAVKAAYEPREYSFETQNGGATP